MQETPSVGTASDLPSLPISTLSDHVLPHVDERTTWNNFTSACKDLREVFIQERKPSPPWPQHLYYNQENNKTCGMISPFLAVSSAYIACGSTTLKHLDVWNVYTGKVFSIANPTMKGRLSTIVVPEKDGKFYMIVCTSESNPRIWNLNDIQPTSSSTTKSSSTECNTTCLNHKGKELFFLEAGGGRPKHLSFESTFLPSSTTCSTLSSSSPTPSSTMECDGSLPTTSTTTTTTTLDFFCISYGGAWMCCKWNADLNTGRCRRIANFSLGSYPWFTKHFLGHEWVATSMFHTDMIQLRNLHALQTGSTNWTCVIQHTVDCITQIAVCPRGKFIAAGGENGAVQVWSLPPITSSSSQVENDDDDDTMEQHQQQQQQQQQWQQHRPLWRVHGLQAQVKSIDFSPDGQYLAGTDGRRVLVWRLVPLVQSLRRGQQQRQNEEDGSQQQTKRSSPPPPPSQGPTINTQNNGNNATSIDMTQNTQPTSLKVHNGSPPIAIVKFTTDGHMLVTARRDGAIRFWSRPHWSC